MGELIGTVYLLFPLLGGALLHGLCVKHNWLAFLAQPVDRGYLVRGRRIFGRNKTFRGPVALSLGAAVVCGLQAEVLHALPAFRQLELFDYGQVNGWGLGAAMGAASMLAELPNSFLKRQFDIGPGQAAQGVRGLLFYILDQVDLLLGVWLVLLLAVSEAVTLTRVLLSLVVVFFVHQLITLIAYALGMRQTLR